MKTVEKIYVQSLEPTSKLPAGLMREIGRVVVMYAHLEWCLSRMTYRVLGIEPNEGRIAVAEPRATDRFSRLRELFNLKGYKFSADLDAIADAIAACQDQRDRLAHGVWFKDPTFNDFMLGIFRGSWQPEPGQSGKTSRKVKPEATPYSLAESRSLVALIEGTLAALIDCNKELLDVRETSREKHRQQTPSRNQSPDQKPGR